MTATPVEKTYVMLMVADMTRALRFYTEAFDVTVVISSPHLERVHGGWYHHRAASRK
jgi:catechol 2,3-dioxygenase-like lactoylglutathione lyase family enzyme